MEGKSFIRQCYSWGKAWNWPQTLEPKRGLKPREVKSIIWSQSTTTDELKAILLLPANEGPMVKAAAEALSLVASSSRASGSISPGLLTHYKIQRRTCYLEAVLLFRHTLCTQMCITWYYHFIAWYTLCLLCCHFANFFNSVACMYLIMLPLQVLVLFRPAKLKAV